MKDNSTRTKEENKILSRVIPGMLFGAAVWVVLFVIFEMVGWPQPRGIVGILLTPEYHDFPSYSVAIFRSIWYLSMYGCVFGGMYLGLRSAALRSKASKAEKEGYHLSRLVFPAMGVSVIIWLGVTIVFYLFEFDIGVTGAHTGVVIALSLGLLLGIIIAYKQRIISKFR